MSFTPVQNLDSFELAKEIREGRISSRELTQLSIKRIEECNPRLNAVAHPMFAQAFEMARMADELSAKIPRHELPALHGVPCTIKDAFAWEGKPWVVGSWYRRQYLARNTAPALQAYLDAGAIPLCFSNVPEALTWIETENAVTGRTNNPHDLSRSAGGSSGGEAALIASGAVTFGLGTDFGGSIRIPSAFCGVAGHKSSAGMIQGDGVWPTPHAGLSRYACIGPLARSASDLGGLMKILPKNQGAIFRDPATVDLRRIKIFYHESNGEFETAPEIRMALQETLSRLRSLGCQVEEWCPKSLKRASKIWMALVSSEKGPSFAEILAGEDGAKPINVAREMLAFSCGRSRHILPNLLLASLESLLKLKPGLLDRYLKEGFALRAELREKLGENAVLLAPVYPILAPKHHYAKLRPFHWTYSGVYNVLEAPATAVKVGMSKKKLPIGLQVVGAPGMDHLTIAVAEKIEARER